MDTFAMLQELLAQNQFELLFRGLRKTVQKKQDVPFGWYI